MPQALVQYSEAGEEAEAALQQELEGLRKRRSQLQQAAASLRGEVEQLQEQGSPLAAGGGRVAASLLGLDSWLASVVHCGCRMMLSRSRAEHTTISHQHTAACRHADIDTTLQSPPALSDILAPVACRHPGHSHRPCCPPPPPPRGQEAGQVLQEGVC